MAAEGGSDEEVKKDKLVVHDGKLVTFKVGRLILFDGREIDYVCLVLGPCRALN